MQVKIRQVQKTAPRVDKLTNICLKKIGHKVYLTSSTSLVGNVDNLENKVNFTPIENPFFHDHSKMVKLTGCEGKHALLRVFFVFISSRSTETDG